jgi:hypothetical protein
MPRSSPPDLPIIGDELGEHILATPSQYDTTARALAREVLIFRAFKKAIRELIESKDIDTVGQQVASFAYISPGEIAEILHRVERAV